MPAFVDSHFTVRQPAWHDLTGENDYDRNPATIDELLDWSGTNWEVLRAPTFRTKTSEQCSKDNCKQGAVAAVPTGNSEGTAWYVCGRHANNASSKGYEVKALPLKQVAGKDALYRSDTGDEIDVANASYEIYQNREAAELVEMLLDPTVTNGNNGGQLNVKFETGGSLKDGAMVWYLARIDEPVEVPGDSSPFYPYVSVLNSHDGSAALRVMNTTVRIVCWNTWSAAEREAGKSGKVYSFRHTGTIRDRIEDARKALFTAKDDAEEWAEYARKMIAIPFEDHQLDRFLAEFVPMPPQHLITDRVAANVEESRNAIKRYYHSPSCASIAGTAWGAIMATGEFLDHGRAYRTKETYVSRTMLKPEQGKAQALKLVEEMVGARA